MTPFDKGQYVQHFLFCRQKENTLCAMINSHCLPAQKRLTYGEALTAHKNYWEHSGLQRHAVISLITSWTDPVHKNERIT